MRAGTGQGDLVPAHLDLTAFIVGGAIGVVLFALAIVTVQRRR